MKKTLKIIGIILIGLLLIVGLLFYFGNKKMEKNILAEKTQIILLKILTKMKYLKNFLNQILKIENNSKIYLEVLRKIVNGKTETVNL